MNNTKRKLITTLAATSISQTSNMSYLRHFCSLLHVLRWRWECNKWVISCNPKIDKEFLSYTNKWGTRSVRCTQHDVLKKVLQHTCAANSGWLPFEYYYQSNSFNNGMFRNLILIMVVIIPSILASLWFWHATSCVYHIRL